MNILKQILIYSIWTIIAILLGISYMRIVLGPNEISSEGLWYLVHIFFDLGLFHIGFRVGLVIAAIFIFLDAFYLKKKIKNNRKATLIRFGILIIITVFVALIHYLLEKVIDVI